MLIIYTYIFIYIWRAIWPLRLSGGLGLWAWHGSWGLEAGGWGEGHMIKDYIIILEYNDIPGLRSSISSIYRHIEIFIEKIAESSIFFY